MGGKPELKQFVGTLTNSDPDQAEGWNFLRCDRATSCFGYKMNYGSWMYTLGGDEKNWVALNDDDDDLGIGPDVQDGKTVELVVLPKSNAPAKRSADRNAESEPATEVKAVPDTGAGADPDA